jgi:hypothetical protein
MCRGGEGFLAGVVVRGEKEEEKGGGRMEMGCEGCWKVNKNLECESRRR